LDVAPPGKSIPNFANWCIKISLISYMFRPAAIVPLGGIRSKTKLYQVIYALTGPVLPWLHARFPKYVTTTEQVARAMIKVAQGGAPKSILENADINNLL
jgi:hypothetical protein